MALPSLPTIAALSNTVSNTTSLEGVRVKEERPDEDEINELAAKMVEINKAKLLTSSLPIPRASVIAPGSGILGYFNKTSNNKPPSSSQHQNVGEQEEKPPEQEKPPIDIVSQRGKFGWVTMGEENIPYILRGEDKYCAVRMVEVKLLAKYLNYLNSDIYSCTCIRSYYITESEAKLLTEINVKHCEVRYGRDPFTIKDLVVRLHDASEFYNFLDLCYSKLVNPASCNSKERCGFIRINNDSVVPYTIKDGKQFVPLFYFEGETDNLKQKADKLESWDLAYLKFCCKVQGIRSELFASETCSVISLADIKSYFPQGTVFDEYWPPKVVDSQLLVQKNAGVRGGSWIKAPPGSVTTPPTSAPVPTVNKEPVDTRIAPPCQQVSNGWPPGLVGNQQRYQPVVSQAAQPRVPAQPPPSSLHNANHSSNNLTRTYSRIQPLSQYYPNVNPRAVHTSLPMTTPTSHIVHQAQPPPLVRVTAANHSLGTSSYSSQSMSVIPHSNSLPIMGGNMMSCSMDPHIQYLPHNNNNNNPSNQNKFPPPPLIAVNGSNQRYYHPTNSEVIDLSSPPQSPQRSIMVNGKQPQGQHPHEDGGTWKNLIPILDTPPRQTNNNAIPFKMQKALVNGKMVPCINAKPYVYSELLMTVNDLIEYFFPQVSLSKCKEVLQNVLQVNLYAGNLQQKTILRDNNKCKTLIENLPLVQLKDVVNYMPQMRYVLERHASTGETPAKRQRIS